MAKVEQAKQSIACKNLNQSDSTLASYEVNETNQVNSKIYWDTRFAENWESAGGPNQSSFFARVAIQNLPTWIIEQLQSGKLTFVDWGCAQGDGTNVWSSVVPSTRMTGIDFSETAIDQAESRYPRIRFLAQDWLGDISACHEKFDVLHSSNTLEHFERPFEVLRQISKMANEAIILTLPYRELERIPEHFASFFPENIPLSLSSGHDLVWSRVVDCRAIPNTCWAGEQVILVYADPIWYHSLGLDLEDCEITQRDVSSELLALQSRVATAEEKLEETKEKFEETKEKLEETKKKLDVVTSEAEAKVLELTTIRSSISWRLTRPLRFARRFVRDPKGATYDLLKSIYWRLPSWARHRPQR